MCNVTERITFGRTRSAKVVDFVTNQKKRVWDFLLVISSNLGPILHLFRDIVARLKIAYSYLLQSHLTSSLGSGWPLTNFWMNLNARTRVFLLFIGEETMMLALCILIQCDGHTSMLPAGKMCKIANATEVDSHIASVVHGCFVIFSIVSVVLS